MSLSLCLTHSHLPRCWTAYNRAWWLKEMSVHSLITLRSNNMLTVLIQSYRASWNWYTCRITWHCSAFCMFHVGVGEHAVYPGVLNLFLFSLFSWLHSQWIVSLSLSHSLLSFSTPSLLYHNFSFAWGGRGHSWPDIQAWLCLREPHAAGTEWGAVVEIMVEGWGGGGRGGCGWKISVWDSEHCESGLKHKWTVK